MDSFAGLIGEGEWDLCSSILSMEELDFTPLIPPPTAEMPDWVCHLDSFTPNLPSCGNAIDQFPCIAAADHYMSMSNAAIEENKMDSIFSACTDVLLQEISVFSGEDRYLNMDVQTQIGNDHNATNSAKAFHHKRKSIVVADDDHHHHNKLNNPTKKIRTSNNKIRKATQNSNKKLSTRRRKCEEDQESGGPDMNSCSSANSSEDDSASQDTNGGGAVLEGEASPPKAKTRATRGSATDPQSLYARKRRERINERLRILQKLVPNGTKVDISTMLEEAVHYVKFLQLQIKLLSSDEMWMYAPIAYNGMDIGLHQKLPSFL